MCPLFAIGRIHIKAWSIIFSTIVDKVCFVHFMISEANISISNSVGRVLIERVVDYLLGDLRGKLKFCWVSFHSSVQSLNNPLLSDDFLPSLLFLRLIHELKIYTGTLSWMTVVAKLIYKKDY